MVKSFQLLIDFRAETWMFYPTVIDLIILLKGTFEYTF